MASALPLQTTITHTPRERTTIVVNGHDPTNVVQALTSETAQEVLAILGDEPGTASDVADTVDTSLQNVRYHIERLCEAGLVNDVDTWYSEKGRGMTVYALTAEELVIQFGGDERQSSHNSEAS